MKGLVQTVRNVTAKFSEHDLLKTGRRGNPESSTDVGHGTTTTEPIRVSLRAFHRTAYL